jgi:hypothetical protein
MTSPEQIVTLVHSLFTQEDLSAPLTVAAHLEAHPEDIAAFVTTVALLGRDVVSFAADHSNTDREAIVNFLRVAEA